MKVYGWVDDDDVRLFASMELAVAARVVEARAYFDRLVDAKDKSQFLPGGVTWRVRHYTGIGWDAWRAENLQVGRHFGINEYDVEQLDEAIG